MTLRGSPRAYEGADEDFAAFHGRVSSLTSRLRGLGGEWEVCWVVEVSPRGIPHVHLLARGRPAAVSALPVEARAAGFGWAEVRPIRHLRPLARYVLKGAIRGLNLPFAEATDLMERHLTLNGGWLLHWTHRFWRSAEGEALRGVRVARIAALRARSKPQS